MFMVCDGLDGDRTTLRCCKKRVAHLCEKSASGCPGAGSESVERCGLADLVSSFIREDVLYRKGHSVVIIIS